MTARIAAAWPRCSGSRWMTELPATLSKVSRGGPSSCLGGGPISWPSSQRHHTLSLLPGFTSVGFRSPLRVGCHCLATSGKRSPNDCPGVGVFDTIWAILRCRPTFPTSQPGHGAATAPKHRSADHTCSLLIFRYPSSRSTGPSKHEDQTPWSDRHSCATLMHLRGVPIAVIAAWLGRRRLSRWRPTRTARTTR